MKDLIKDGDVILDGTESRNIKIMEALMKLQTIQAILKRHNIESLEDLDYFLSLIPNLKWTHIEQVIFS